ncbi:MAG: hypothetical protein IKD62_05960 [Oscillospiraceae bacterium]|nr:hypothetical protein [Oscillospiraceae bacterium]
MEESISIRDTFVGKQYKKNFYHGLLLGLLKGDGRWLVRSNTESRFIKRLVGSGAGIILVSFHELRIIIAFKDIEEFEETPSDITFVIAVS